MMERQLLLVQMPLTDKLRYHAMEAKLYCRGRIWEGFFFCHSQRKFKHYIITVFHYSGQKNLPTSLCYLLPFTSSVFTEILETFHR